MWRGWHKFPGGDATFDKLSNIPSTFPVSSRPGEIHIAGSDGEHLFAKVVDDAFQLSVYDSIVAAAELKGFEPALLNQGSGQQENGISMTNIRSSYRCIMDDVILSEKLWSIAENNLPSRDVVPGKRYKGWVATGVNPRFRILKYSPGERFEMHQDGSYRIEPHNGEGHEQQSFMTLQLYLNNGGGIDFTGGSTRFIEPLNSISLSKHDSDLSDGAIAKVHDVVPITGRLLLFQHNCWHEGEMVTSGIKYVLRSEIMYSRSKSSSI